MEVTTGKQESLTNVEDMRLWITIGGLEQGGFSK